MNNQDITEVNKELIRKAFLMGMAWGETYTGWFVPTQQQTEDEINAAINELL